jgi:Flp pilus assembly protein TadG
MLGRSFRYVRSFIAPPLGDRRGAAAVFLAVSLVPMVGAIGLAVDSSLGYLLKTRMGKSLDAAGLAAGRMALDENAEATAEAFFLANFGNSDGTIKVDDFDFDLDENNRLVTLSATATAPTYFMRVFGHSQMTVSARTVVERETTGMELALVMDNTGSMWGSAYTAMETAALDLVEILYGDESEIENLWVSLVPYTATVNIGTDHSAWLVAGDPARTNSGGFATQAWKGCVQARTTPLDTDDTPPSGGAFTSYLYPSVPKVYRADSDDVDRDRNKTEKMWFDDDNLWPPLKTSIADENRGVEADRNTARGPNLGCGAPITPLTASRATIEAAIDAMGPTHRGGTTGNLGLSWGWRTISPEWRGLWGGETPATHPLDYGTAFMEKVVVILTDGNNQFHDQDGRTGTPASDWTAYGRIESVPGVNSSSGASDKRAQGREVLDERMAGTCAAMKAEGIRIYSIIFGASPDATAQSLFRGCATTPAMYYYAPDNAKLAAAFKAIGGQLANLRIVE